MIETEIWSKESSASEFFERERAVSSETSDKDLRRLWDLAYRLGQFPNIDSSHYYKRLKELEELAHSRSRARELAELWWLSRYVNVVPLISRTSLQCSPKKMLPYYQVYHTLSFQPGKEPFGFLVNGEPVVTEEGQIPHEVIQQATRNVRLDHLVHEVSKDWKVLRDMRDESLCIYKPSTLPTTDGGQADVYINLSVPMELADSPAFQSWL